MFVRRIVLATLAYIFCAPTVRSESLQDAQTLYDTLLTGYNKNIRPVLNQSQPVVINMTFDFISIREFDEITGKLSIVGILYMTWIDPRITWNPLLHNGAVAIQMPQTEVWKPELVIGHPIENIMAVGYSHKWNYVHHYFNGYALYAPADVLSTTCSVDVTYYPFDTQHCEMMFIPWGQSLNEVQLVATEVDALMNYWTPNGEWNLIQAKTKTELVRDAYPTFVVEVTMARRPTFVIVNVVLPILFMGFLNSLVFYLPSKSGERVSYSMTVLLAIAVFMTLVGDNLPKTSEPMSTLCYFLLANLVMSSVIMLVTVFNLGIYFRTDKTPVPNWVAILTKIILRKQSKRVLDGDKVTPIEQEGLENTSTTKEEKTSDGKWAYPVDDEHNDVDDVIKWTDVSHAVDRMALFMAFAWLTFSTVSFFVLVVTQSRPGA